MSDETLDDHEGDGKGPTVIGGDGKGPTFTGDGQGPTSPPTEPGGGEGDGKGPTLQADATAS